MKLSSKHINIYQKKNILTMQVCLKYRVPLLGVWHELHPPAARQRLEKGQLQPREGFVAALHSGDPRW